MRTRITCLLLFVFSITTFAQSDLAIGQWKSHLPYNVSWYVTEGNKKVYFATQWSVLEFGKEDFSLTYLSTVSGLSNTGVKLVKYNQAKDVLIVVYNNSSFDLVKEDEIITNFDIPNAVNISGDKKVYDIYMEEDRAWFCTGYGVSMMDLNTEDFRLTANLGFKINGLVNFGGYLFAASDEGIYRVGNNLVLEDINNWELMDSNFGFPDDYSSLSLAEHQGQLLVTVDHEVYRYNVADETLELFYEAGPGFELRYMTSNYDNFMAGYLCATDTLCSTSKVHFILADGTEGDKTSCIDRPLYGVADENGWLFMPDEWADMRFSLSPDDCIRRTYGGPFSHFTNKMTIVNDELWVASGGISENQSYLWRVDGFFSLIGNTWEFYNAYNQAVLEPLRDFYDIAVHPSNGKVYCSSYLDGLVELDNGELTLFDKSSSQASLMPFNGSDSSRTRVSGLVFDEDENLWIGNYNAVKPISVLKADGTWQNFSSVSGRNQLLFVELDRSGNKWFVDGAGGMVVFDEGEMNVATDDRKKALNRSNTILESDVVRCITTDLEGDVWVGTKEGAYVFECDPFDDNCVGSRRIVKVGGFNAYLLETEDVRCIAVDGANRKWFGTTNGVFVQSANGEEMIAHFTIDNSPLFDNTITDIAINDNTGEVYIGTNKGLISYRTDATGAGDFHSTSIYAYPNPVRPEYDGPIAIKGLARDANVKITDISGTLVYETKALGGQAIWDGTDYNGRRANSGVYLVFSTSSQSPEMPEAYVTKILLLH